MNLAPDDELELIAATARRFGEDVLAARMRDAEAAGDVDRATREAFAEIGMYELSVCQPSLPRMTRNAR